jgi:thioredoxin-like negative regulator of GroEL
LETVRDWKELNRIIKISKIPMLVDFTPECGASEEASRNLRNLARNRYNGEILFVKANLDEVTSPIRTDFAPTLTMFLHGKKLGRSIEGSSGKRDIIKWIEKKLNQEPSGLSGEKREKGMKPKARATGFNKNLIDKYPTTVATKTPNAVKNISE